MSGSGITIEVWLTTARTDQTGPARIVSYSGDHVLRNFTLGQENRDLVFRLRTTGTDLNGMNPEAAVADVFIPGQRQQITVTYDFSQTQVYVDGARIATFPGPSGSFSNWDCGHELLLGNEQTGDRAWIGSIEEVIIHDRPLTPAEVQGRHASRDAVTATGGIVAAFDFADGDGGAPFTVRDPAAGITLEAPATFRNLDAPSVLDPRARQVSDVVTNFALYLPFGLLCALVLLSVPSGTRPPAAIAAFVATGLLSLVAELMQFFVEGRTSALLDLASALAGGSAGIAIALALGSSAAKRRPVR